LNLNVLLISSILTWNFLRILLKITAISEVDGFVKTIFPSFLDALPREEWLPEG